MVVILFYIIFVSVLYLFNLILYIMGVRLYPIVKANVSKVDAFNKVAPYYGNEQLTPERVAVYEALTAKYDSNEIDADEYFETLYNGSNDDIKAFSSFVLNGFGKFKSVYEQHHHYFGEEKSEYYVDYLCVINDIPLEIMEVIDGFYWV